MDLIIKESTKSICPKCYTEIKAEVIGQEGMVYMVKDCPIHGSFTCLIEKDIEFYMRVMNKEFLTDREPVEFLFCPVTYRCNENCNICSLPYGEKEDIPLSKLKEAIYYSVAKYIPLVGGEPALSENLPELIQFTLERGKLPILLTNGLRLLDNKYLKTLKNAGLEWIVLSFNGFDDNVYEKINNKRLWKIKLATLRNLKKQRMKVSISTLIVDENDCKCIKSLLHFCLKNSSFIKELRIRSVANIGRRNITYKHFYLSELVKIFATSAGFTFEEIMDYQSRLKNSQVSHSTCHFSIYLFYLLMVKADREQIWGSWLKKAIFVYKLIPMVGINNVFKMIINKILGKEILLDFKIELRTWFDINTIDLGEIQFCHSAHITEDGGHLPLCYYQILQSKDSEEKCSPLNM